MSSLNIHSQISTIPQEFLVPGHDLSKTETAPIQMNNNGSVPAPKRSLLKRIKSTFTPGMNAVKIGSAIIGLTGAAVVLGAIGLRVGYSILSGPIGISVLLGSMVTTGIGIVRAHKKLKEQGVEDPAKKIFYYAFKGLLTGGIGGVFTALKNTATSYATLVMASGPNTIKKNGEVSKPVGNQKTRLLAKLTFIASKIAVSGIIMTALKITTLFGILFSNPVGWGVAVGGLVLGIAILLYLKHKEGSEMTMLQFIKHVSKEYLLRSGFFSSIALGVTNGVFSGIDKGKSMLRSKSDADLIEQGRAASTSKLIYA